MGPRRVIQASGH